MFYMKHIKQKSFLRTSPICFLLFVNKILILIFYFYWKHFMPSIPSKGISLAQKVKNLLLNVGDIGSVPGSRRSPGEGNGNSFQHFCLGNPMNRGASGLQSMGLQELEQLRD